MHLRGFCCVFNWSAVKKSKIKHVPEHFYFQHFIITNVNSNE